MTAIHIESETALPSLNDALAICASRQRGEVEQRSKELAEYVSNAALPSAGRMMELVALIVGAEIRMALYEDALNAIEGEIGMEVWLHHKMFATIENTHLGREMREARRDALFNITAFAETLKPVAK